MQFYPISFPIDADTREVSTQITGKKMALSDVAVNIRGVMCKQHGAVTEIKVPHFKLERYGAGYKLTWDEELEQSLEVVLEAQGNGGQTARAHLFLRLEDPAGAEPEVAKPGLSMSPTEKFKALTAMGVTDEAALAVIKDKLGDDAEAGVKRDIVRELSA
jgi:hypothetical protein